MVGPRAIVGRDRWGAMMGRDDGAIEIASIETFVPLA